MKLLYLVPLLILVLLVSGCTIPFQKQLPTVSCIKEGELKKDLTATLGECCTGLNELFSGYRDGKSYCTSAVCGDGICSGTENQFNCEKDCKKENKEIQLKCNDLSEHLEPTEEIKIFCNTDTDCTPDNAQKYCDLIKPNRKLLAGPFPECIGTKYYCGSDKTCKASTHCDQSIKKAFTKMTYEERLEYCPKLCGGLNTHDPCANDCMAGVESEYTKKRDFASMSSEELMKTCKTLCPSPRYGGPCVTDCVINHKNIQRHETNTSDACSSDANCFCKNFTGAEFLPGFTQGTCNEDTGFCNACKYL